MKDGTLQELQRRRQRQLLRLNEVLDLTTQLAQGIDRTDQISVQMLISMRQEPIMELQEMEEGIRSYVLTLPEADAIRCHELLQGGAPLLPSEEAFCAQNTQYRRILESVISLDKRLSLKLGGRSSFYNSFR